MVSRIQSLIASYIQGEYRLERESEDRIQAPKLYGDSEDDILT
jgi:hypothetical protein